MKIVKPVRATRTYTQRLVAAGPLCFQLRAVECGAEADVTYSHTSLGPAGDAFVASFTQEFYRTFMQDWESRINHYLLHGTALA